MFDVSSTSNYYFRYSGFNARLILWVNAFMPSRITVAICVSMAGVGGKSRLFSGGTEFLVISGIIYLYICFEVLFLFLRCDYVMSCFPWLHLFLPGIKGEDLTHRRDEFPS